MPASQAPTSPRRMGHFVVVREVPITELQATLIELQHERSGARVIHIGCDDPENLFCLSFPTYPVNSNGVAHILEHIALCGSKKFPIKDPFFCMMRRSLATFMNAMTGADFTCYPASSQLPQDFYNLLEVYLDAVFHPTLSYESFLQEGHRLEWAQPGNHKSPLLRKGIVYNEMKGSLAAPESRLWHEMLAALCPDLTYAHNSGGDPKEIAHLSYEELIGFYDTYYHPSQCLFFFYGNMPLEGHLEFIQHHTLGHVLPIALPPVAREQRRFTQPLYREAFYPAQEGEDFERQHYVTFGWLTCQAKQQEELLAFALLDSILMDTDASPLRARLQGSGLCVQATGGLDPEMSEVPYLIVCRGCRKDQVEQLDALLRKALADIAEEGISSELIESSLHQLEFARTEIGSNHHPFGLTLFFRAALGQQHGCLPEYSLQIHALFARLRAHLQNPQFLPDLIRRYLLDNPHSVRLTMIPRPGLTEEEEQAEAAELKQLAGRLSKEECIQIDKDKERLATYQEEAKTASPDCLPIIALSEVSRSTREFPLQKISLDGLDIFHHDCCTNGILYLDLLYDIPPLRAEDLPLLQVWSSLMTEVGVGDRDYAAQLAHLQAHTGGVGAAIHWHVPVDRPHALDPALNLRGKALARHAPALCSILRDTALRARCNEQQRLRELLQQGRSHLKTRLVKQAMSYTTSLAAQGLSELSWIHEQMHGLTFYEWFLRETQDLDHQLAPFIQRLQQVASLLQKCHRPHLVISCEESLFQDLVAHSFYGLTEVARPGISIPTWPEKPFPLPILRAEARPIPSPVSFTCQAWRTATYGHPQAPALSIATQLLNHLILLPKIREEGGAYGTGATYAPGTGRFLLHSFRDPHISATATTFQEALLAIGTQKFNAQDLLEAKLSFLQHLDSPISPSSRALTAYTREREGKTQALRQHYREGLLDLSPEAIAAAIQEQFLTHPAPPAFAVLASDALLAKEAPLLKEQGLPVTVRPLTS